jgi:hypothetical protein
MEVKVGEATAMVLVENRPQGSDDCRLSRIVFPDKDINARTKLN